jgi:hypothetical protein
MTLDWTTLVIFAVWSIPLPKIVEANIRMIAGQFPMLSDDIIKSLALLFGLFWPVILTFNLLFILVLSLQSRD